MKKSMAILTGVLLLLSLTACGPKGEPAVQQETAAPIPAATKAPKAETQAVRQVGAYAVVVNEGSRKDTYPYMVQTEHSTWLLAKDDLTLMGEETFYAGLADILQYVDADMADAQKALAGRIPAQIPPVEIRTDFCGKAEISQSTGAYYNSLANMIKLFHSWEMARESLLHEYVHYLTFHCAEKKTVIGFYAEAVAEYVSRILCENRMMRSMDPAQAYGPEMVAAMRAWGVWDETLGGPDYIKSALCESDAFARGLYDDVSYLCVGQFMFSRKADRRLPEHLDQLCYGEAASLALYLMETYGVDTFLDNWDLPGDKVAELYGLSETELLTAWSEWNAEQCEKLGIRMEFAAIREY